MCGWARGRLEALGAHLLAVQGDEGTRASLQHLREVRGQTLLDGKHQPGSWSGISPLLSPGLSSVH